MFAPRCLGSLAMVHRVSETARNSIPYTSRLFCNASGPMSLGSVKTTWKYGTLRRSSAFASSHCALEESCKRSLRVHTARTAPCDHRALHYDRRPNHAAFVAASPRCRTPLGSWIRSLRRHRPPQADAGSRRRLAFGREFQQVGHAFRRLQCVGRHMEVDGGGLQVRMTEQELDGAQIGTGLQ